MQKILVEVSIPLIGEKYDMFIPINLTIYNVLKLIVKTINENGILLNEGTYTAYNSDNGCILDVNSIVKKSGLQNGSRITIV